MPFPDICVQDGFQCPNAWPTLRFQERTCGEQFAHLRDNCGKPFPLDPDIHKVCLIAVERYSAPGLYINKEAEIVDAEEAEVKVSLVESELTKPGLFLGEYVVFLVDAAAPASSDSSSSSPSGSSSAPSGSSSSSVPVVAPESTPKALHRFPCYVEVEPNVTYLDTPPNRFHQPLSIAEIRLAVRDKCAEDNFLLDNVQFTDTEIAWAMRRPIDYWNEIPPPLNPRYDVATFPYRYNYLDAIVGELLIMTGLNEERNRLRYSAANLAVDDLEHGETYRKAGMAYRQVWEQWVRDKKKEINIGQAFRTTNLRAFGNRRGLRGQGTSNI